MVTYLNDASIINGNKQIQLNGLPLVATKKVTQMSLSCYVIKLSNVMHCWVIQKTGKEFAIKQAILFEIHHTDQPTNGQYRYALFAWERFIDAIN